MPDERSNIDHRNDPEHIDPEIEALLRELDLTDLEGVAPPPSVWAGIEAELAAEPAPVVELAARRPAGRQALLLAVAAALLIVVVGAAVVINRTGGDTVLATSDLSYDPEAFDPLGAGATATAHLVERDDGFAIELTGTSFPAVGEDADLELWLIEADASGTIVDVAPVSLVGGAGSYEVPDGLDVSTHRIVDISIEPRDGDDAHSGRSILRGVLEA